MNENNNYITKEEYDRFINQNDYEGLANRLSEIECNTLNEQIKLNNVIESVRREGKIKSEMLKFADKEEHQAIAFNSAIKTNRKLPGLNAEKDNNGNDIKGTQNKFSKDYINCVNQLGNSIASESIIDYPFNYKRRFVETLSNIAPSTEKQTWKNYFEDLIDSVYPTYNVPKSVSNPNEIATALAIRFEGNVNKRYGTFLEVDWLAKDEYYENNAFELFLKQNGINEQFLKDNHIHIEKDPNDSNATIIKLTKSNPLFDTIINNLSKVTTTGDLSGEARYKIAGINSKGEYIKALNSTFDSQHEDAIGLTTSDRSVSDGYFYDPNRYSDAWRALNKIRQRADYLENKIKNKVKDINNDKAVPMIISNNLGARAMEIEDRFNRGIINKSTRDALIEDNNAIFDRALNNYSFTQYEVYANDPESDDFESLHKINNSNDKAKLQELFRSQIGTKNLSYSAAIVNGVRGTVVTIKPKMSKDSEKGNLPDDIKQPHRTVFIPGLFKNSLEETINKDTKVKTAYEYSQMLTYGYSLDIPGEGKIKINKDKTAILTDNTGNEIYLDNNQALSLINKAVFLKDVTNKINNTIFGSDNKRRTDINSDSFKKLTAIRINALMQQAMVELYPEAINNYNTIAKLINDKTYNNVTIDDAKEEIDFLNHNYSNLQNLILNSIKIKNIPEELLDKHYIKQ